GAISARGKGKTRYRIKAVGIHALAYWNRTDHFAGIAVDKRHESIVAADDKNFVLCIYGQARRRFAWGQWPRVFDLKSFCVKFYQRTFVFKIDEDFAFAIRGRKFRSAAQTKRADQLSGGGINRGRSVGFTVECEDTLREWIVNHRVGTLIRFGCA